MKPSSQITWLFILTALMLFIRSDAFPKLVEALIEWAKGLAA